MPTWIFFITDLVGSSRTFGSPAGRPEGRRPEPHPVYPGRGGLSMGGLGALPKDHDLDRVEEDREVEQERLVLDVEEVELELLDGVLEARAVPVADLGPPRQAGLHDVPLA